jgi:hypothetical protein
MERQNLVECRPAAFGGDATKPGGLLKKAPLNDRVWWITVVGTQVLAR